MARRKRRRFARSVRRKARAQRTRRPKQPPTTLGTAKTEPTGFGSAGSTSQINAESRGNGGRTRGSNAPAPVAGQGDSVVTAQDAPPPTSITRDESRAPSLPPVFDPGKQLTRRTESPARLGTLHRKIEKRDKAQDRRDEARAYKAIRVSEALQRATKHYGVDRQISTRTVKVPTEGPEGQARRAEYVSQLKRIRDTARSPKEVRQRVQRAKNELLAGGYTELELPDFKNRHHKREFQDALELIQENTRAIREGDVKVKNMDRGLQRSIQQYRQMEKLPEPEESGVPSGLSSQKAGIGEAPVGAAKALRMPLEVSEDLGLVKALDYLTRPGAAVTTGVGKFLAGEDLGPIPGPHLIKGKTAERIHRANSPGEAFTQGYGDKDTLTGGDIGEGLFGARWLGLPIEILLDPVSYVGVGAAYKTSASVRRVADAAARIQQAKPERLVDEVTAELLEHARRSGDYGRVADHLETVADDIGAASPRGRRPRGSRKLEQQEVQRQRTQVARMAAERRAADEAAGRTTPSLASHELSQAVAETYRTGKRVRSPSTGLRLRVLSPFGNEKYGLNVPLPGKFKVPVTGQTRRLITGTSGHGVGYATLDEVFDAIGRSRTIHEVSRISNAMARNLDQDLARRLSEVLRPITHHGPGNAVRRVGANDDAFNRVGFWMHVRQMHGSADAANARLGPLSREEEQVVAGLDSLFADLATQGKDLGILSATVPFYYPRLWNQNARQFDETLDPTERLQQGTYAGTSTGASGSYAKHRVYSDIAAKADPKLMADAYQRLSRAKLTREEAIRLAEEDHQLARGRMETELLVRDVERGAKLHFNELTPTEQDAVRFELAKGEDSFFKNLEDTDGILTLSRAAYRADAPYGATERAYELPPAEAVSAKVYGIGKDIERLRKAEELMGSAAGRRDLVAIRQRLERQRRSLKGREYPIEDRVAAAKAIARRNRAKDRANKAKLARGAGRARARRAYDPSPRSINKREWYHGSSARDLSDPDITLDPKFTDSTSLFGKGIYLTTKPNVGRGYAQWNKTGTVHHLEVRVKNPVDLEAPIDGRFEQALYNAWYRVHEATATKGTATPSFEDNVRARAEDYVREHWPDNPTRDTVYPVATNGDLMRAWLDNFTDGMGWDPSEIDSEANTLLDALRDEGYDSLTHKGGTRWLGPQSRGYHQTLIVLAPDRIKAVAPRHQKTPPRTALKPFDPQRPPNDVWPTRGAPGLWQRDNLQLGAEDSRRTLYYAHGGRFWVREAPEEFEGAYQIRDLDDVGSYPADSLAEAARVIDAKVREGHGPVKLPHGPRGIPMSEVPTRTGYGLSQHPPRQDVSAEATDPLDYGARLPDDREKHWFPILDPAVNTFYRTRTQAVNAALRARWQGIDKSVGINVSKADAHGLVKRGNGTWWEGPDGRVWRRPHNKHDAEQGDHVGRAIGAVVGPDRLWPDDVVWDVRAEALRMGENEYRQMFNMGAEKLFNRTLSLMRYGVTTPFPAFHIRNMVSDVLKSIQAGGTGLIFHPLTTARIMGLAVRRERFGKIPFTRKNNPWHAARVKLGRDGVDVPGVGRMNYQDFLFMTDIFGIRNGQHLSEFLRLGATGRRASKRERAQTAAALHLGPEGAIGKRMIELGSRREDIMRFATFTNRMRHNGGDVAEAAWYMTKHHFDYNDLTANEKRIFRNLFMFYTWYRKNIPLQFAEIISRPGFFAAVANTYYSLERGETPMNQDWSKLSPLLPDMSGDAPTKNAVPDYFHNPLGAITVPWNDYSAAFAFAAPWTDMNIVGNLAYPLANDAQGLRNAFAMANPLASLGYQLASGTELLTGRDLKEYEPVPDYIGSILRQVGIETKTSEDGETLAPAVVDLMLGYVPIMGRASGYFTQRAPSNDETWLGRNRNLVSALGFNTYVTPPREELPEKVWTPLAMQRASERRDYSEGVSNLPDTLGSGQDAHDKAMRAFDRETRTWAREHGIPMDWLVQQEGLGFTDEDRPGEGSSATPKDLSGGSSDSGFQGGGTPKDLSTDYGSDSESGTFDTTRDRDKTAEKPYELPRQRNVTAAGEIPTTVPARNNTERPPPEVAPTRTPEERRRGNKPQPPRTLLSRVPDYVPEEYRRDIAKASRENGLRPELLAAQLQAESNFNPDAGSPMGAQGIAQFMPGTAASYNLDPSDPHDSIRAQGEMMGELMAKYKSERLALAAYNAGSGAVDAAGGIPDYPETVAYVDKVMAAAGNGTPQRAKGQWEGSQRIVRELIGDYAKTEDWKDKEDRGGNGSFHDLGSENAFAADLPADEAIVDQIAKKLGLDPAEINYGDQPGPLTYKGYEIEFLPYTHGSGRHVHIGARWNGGEPPPGTVSGGTSGAVPPSGGSYGLPGTSTTLATAKPSERPSGPDNPLGRRYKYDYINNPPKSYFEQLGIDPAATRDLPTTRAFTPSYDIPIEEDVEELIRQLRVTPSHSMR
jgi:hypothetical protein